MLGVIERWIGATGLGAIRVIEGAEKVRMPRLPKLPPMRASAAPAAASEKTITRAANKLPSFTNRDVVIEQLRQIPDTDVVRKTRRC